jgi:hydroxypyruvate isomerase
MEPVICIEMIYPNDDFLTRIDKVYQHGFKNIEFWGWRDKDVDAFKQKLTEKGMKVANFSAQRVGNLVDKESHQILFDDFKDALVAAEELNAKTLMVLTNELDQDGFVVNPFDNLSYEEKKENTIVALKKMLEMAPNDLTIVVESLNTVKDHMGYFLYDIDEAVKLVKEIGDKRLKVLFDLYHQGMMGDDLIDLIERNIDYVGYFHVADYPGRGEPGTGKGDWKTILSKIKQKGYTGGIGFEYQPAGDDDKSLVAIRSLWDSL